MAGPYSMTVKLALDAASAKKAAKDTSSLISALSTAAPGMNFMNHALGGNALMNTNSANQSMSGTLGTAVSQAAQSFVHGMANPLKSTTSTLFDAGDAIASNAMAIGGSIGMAVGGPIGGVIGAGIGLGAQFLWEKETAEPKYVRGGTESEMAGIANQLGTAGIDIRRQDLQGGLQRLAQLSNHKHARQFSNMRHMTNSIINSMTMVGSDSQGIWPGGG